MAGTISVETLAQFETIGMPARNLAFHQHREYSHDLQGSPQLSDAGRASCLVFRQTVALSATAKNLSGDSEHSVGSQLRGMSPRVASMPDASAEWPYR